MTSDPPLLLLLVEKTKETEITEGYGGVRK
jgi:hypothetical protein